MLPTGSRRQLGQKFSGLQAACKLAGWLAAGKRLAALCIVGIGTIFTAGAPGSLALAPSFACSLASRDSLHNTLVVVPLAQCELPAWSRLIRRQQTQLPATQTTTIEAR